LSIKQEDFFHLEAETACALLRERGMACQLQVTTPPRGAIQGQLRVVRAKVQDGVVVLTATHFVSLES
jgi:hypothetical protein